MTKDQAEIQKLLAEAGEIRSRYKLSRETLGIPLIKVFAAGIGIAIGYWGFFQQFVEHKDKLAELKVDLANYELKKLTNQQDSIRGILIKQRDSSITNNRRLINEVAEANRKVRAADAQRKAIEAIAQKRLDDYDSISLKYTLLLSKYSTMANREVTATRSAVVRYVTSKKQQINADNLKLALITNKWELTYDSTKVLASFHPDGGLTLSKPREYESLANYTRIDKWELVNNQLRINSRINLGFRFGFTIDFNSTNSSDNLFKGTANTSSGSVFNWSLQAIK